MKVSILVPVYGVEKDIRRCAESLMAQTYEDIEYIFVDDCTPDRSIEILQEVVERYPQRKAQVRIIHHEQNGGLSAARTTAINEATGEFIIHVDGDDWVDRRMVEILVKEQKATGADIVFSSFVMHAADHEEKIDKHFSGTAQELSLAIVRKEFMWNVWGSLQRLSIYREHNIHPEQGANMGEDYQVMPQITYFARSIAFVPEYLVYYNLDNDGSFGRRGFRESTYLQGQRSSEIVYQFCQDKGEEMQKAAAIARLRSAAAFMLTMSLGRAPRKYYEENHEYVRHSNRSLWHYVGLADRIIMHLGNYYLVSAFASLQPIKRFFFPTHSYRKSL